MIKKLPNWLLITLFGVFLARIPSLLEPFYYGDEMIYLTLGNGIRKGLVLYRDLHDNKPPLLYFLAGIAGNVFWFRAILCFWMLATIILFYCFTKKIFKNKTAPIASTICFAILTTLPFFEGHIANAEIFMIGPIIGAFMLVWDKPNYIRIFAAGLLLSIAALFKIPSIFDAGAFVFLFFLLLKPNLKSFRTFLISCFVLFFGIAVPIALTFLWYLGRGAFHEYLVAAFLQNFGYVSTWNTNASQTSFLVKNGPLLARGVLVLVSFALLFLLKKKRSKIFVVACAWLATGLFAATLSARPYPHYFVQVLPPIAILFGFLFTGKTLEQMLVIFPLTAAFIIPVYFGFWQYSVSNYFGRVGKLQDFSPTVKRDYELAKFINSKTSPDDKVFIWGDSPGIYALSRRIPAIKYTSYYHIHDFSSESEVLDWLRNTPPKLIIFLNEAPYAPLLFNFTRIRYILISSPEGATVWYNTANEHS